MIYRFIFLMLAILSLFLITPDFKRNYSPDIVLVGGGNIPKEVRSYILYHSKQNLVIITSASLFPDAQGHYDFWKETGINVKVITNEPPWEDIEKAGAVWFTGGDQKRLIESYPKDKLYQALSDVLRRGGVVGGTSAGASIMGKVMVYEDYSITGLGLTDLVIDQHFTVRNRFARLEKVAKSVGLDGIGIDEGTGIFLKTGKIAGKGKVIVVKSDIDKIMKKR